MRPQMFDLDEAKRISIPEIREHPWYSKPVPERHQTALASLAENQEETNKKLAAGMYEVSERSVWM